MKEPLSERIVGRVSVHDVRDPMNNKVLVKAGEIIDEEVAQIISETAIELVEIWAREAHGVREVMVIPNGCDTMPLPMLDPKPPAYRG